MSTSFDLELKKAFVELQVKMIESTKKIHEIDSQLSKLENMLLVVVKTHRGLSTLPPDTKTYESVGRMFLLTDLEEFKSNLKIRETQIAFRTIELTNNKQYLEKNLKESEDNIREMVQHKKDQSDTKS